MPLYPPSNGAVTDNVTISGAGTSLLPITIKQVETDSTLTGAGTVASPLSVVGGGGAGLTLINSNAGPIVIGQAVYSSSSGHVDKAEANAAATATVVGLVGQASIASTASGTIQSSGPLTATTGQWDAVTGDVGGLVFNAIYYLDPATPGKITKTVPSTVGQFIAPIGKAASTTQLVIGIQPTILL